ncbi:keratin, type I cytoskeletal 18-A-like [Clarias gariepinus]|uniref:keratin, type I cytoskeletal 18-A-like n=1 Tax=Clarias gariepinus TaxID=13013 RepID=UPI00234E0B6F|nr:keratin, type I cytoskeletal 18-A-like [Clarias gariepinus]
MVFCAVKRGDAQKTQEPGDTVDDPLCDLATEPAPVQPTTVPQDSLKDSVSMGAKMIQELEDRVRELEELLSESHRNSEIKSKRFDEECEAYSKLKSEYNDLKKTVMQNQELLKEFERERKAHSNLQVEYDKLKIIAMHNEKLLQEFEREREAHSNLQVKCEKLKITAMHNEELLQSSLAKAKQKHQKAMVCIAQLEDEKDDLIKEVKALRETVEDLGNLLSETNKDYDELIEECERERKAHSIIQSQYEELKKTVICSEEVLKDSLAKAEQKHQEALKSIAQLENENTNEVETLRETVEDLGNLLCETSRDCDKLTEECERERTAHSKLLSQLDKLKLTVMCREEVLKSSLAQAEQKHQEYISLLEGENASLIKKVKTLRETIEDLGNLLCESNRNCDELMRQVKTLTH